MRKKQKRRMETQLLMSNAHIFQTSGLYPKKQSIHAIRMDGLLFSHHIIMEIKSLEIFFFSTMLITTVLIISATNQVFIAKRTNDGPELSYLFMCVFAIYVLFMVNRVQITMDMINELHEEINRL